MALTEKHRRLLELIKANKYSVEELSQKSSYSEEYINDLIGNSPKTGAIGEEFQAALRKVRVEISARISHKTELVREKLINKLTQWVECVGGGTEVDTKTKHKMLVDAINAISKSMPYSVNIENYTWKEGITSEEAVHEFKRIAGLARAAAIRRRVSEFAAAGTVEDAVPDGLSDKEAADSQNTLLQAKPETGDVPQE